MKTALVTGGNKGIGFEISKQLLQKGVYVILACRDEERGKEAIKKLNTEGFKNTEFRKLDLDDLDSISSCAQQIQQSHQQIDVLINNAAILFKQTDPTPFPQQAALTIKTNFFGTLAVSDKFFPIIKDGGRVINISSGLGNLQLFQSQELQNKLKDTELTIPVLSNLMNEYVTDAEKGLVTSKGWPSGTNGSYSVSKAGVIAMSNIHAKQLASRSITVNSCSPGYCATDMTSGNGIYTAAQGAQTPVWLATREEEENNKSTGLYFANLKVMPWY